jgi:hypothetical protein
MLSTGLHFASECLRVQIGFAAQKATRGMMRDLFEAGLNEAAGSLAASYGRWSFARSVERIRYSWRGGRSRQRRKGSERDSREAWILDDDLCWVHGRDGRCRSARREFAGARRWIARVSILVGPGDMVGELGVMSGHTVALNVAAKMLP